ncbi:MAG: InlB B-repeat-containing protein, partial [Actinomycetaceae bacterium]|nr:InlB B-repeat-containing protein [Actinomycetaceae bacterium]
VSYDGNGGKGSMDSATVDKGSTYKLLDSGFTAPANQKFKGWKIGDTEYAPGDEITVNEDTKVEAVWEDIPAPAPDAKGSTPGGNAAGKKGNSSLPKTGAEIAFSALASAILLASGGALTLNRKRRIER